MRLECLSDDLESPERPSPMHMIGWNVTPLSSSSFGSSTHSQIAYLTPLLNHLSSLSRITTSFVLKEWLVSLMCVYTADSGMLSTLQGLLCSKDKKRNLVCGIRCQQEECEEFFVKETQLSLKARMNQHRRPSRYPYSCLSPSFYLHSSCAWSPCPCSRHSWMSTVKTSW